MSRSVRLTVLAGPAVVLALVFSGVRPTNFSGWDEWLIVSLSARGIMSVPYAHRPLVLVWARPGALLVPHDLLGYFLAHAAYLTASGVLTAWLALRLRPEAPLLALTAGVLATVWAPLDYMRLDTVLLTSYSGFTAASLLAVVLFLEGWRRRRRALALLAALLAGLTALAFEGTLPLLAGAPLLPLMLDEPDASPARGRTWLGWAVAWEAVLALAALPLAFSLAHPAAGSYQSSALGMDLHPLRLAGRVLLQYRFDLWPALTSSPLELGRPLVGVAVGAFLILAVVAARGAGDAWPSRAALLRLMGAGLVLAGLGWIALCASPAIRTPARAQLLSAPGIGLFLGALGALPGALVSSGALRRALLVLVGAWLVAVGTGRTLAMQAEWDRASYWPVQSGALAQLTREAPSLRPGTLVVLLDEANAFPATFTFRHALAYLYGPEVTGQVWKGQDFLYPARFLPTGVEVEPWPTIRGPWQDPATRHGYDAVVVARMSARGTLRILDEWPPELPPLPAGAAYAPRRRLGPGAPPPSQRILARRG